MVHRAFHALPALTSPKGVVVNAIFGFSSILMKMIKEIGPEYIVATFDLAGKTFRHEEFEEYKSHRVKAPDELYSQMDTIKEVLKSFGIPIFEMQGYEADDVVGTIATKAKTQKDLQVVITTGDLDTLQLVDDDKVVVFTLRKGMTDTIIYDKKAVVERYGLQPSQLNDFKGLKGDPSDNIPGVSGIGEKTASTLISEFGDLDGLYAYLEKRKKGDKKVSDKLAEKLLSGKDQAFFSKQLSTIVIDLDLDFDIKKAEWRKHADFSRIEKIFRDLGFSSLIRRFPEINPDFNTADKISGQSTKESETVKYDKSAVYFLPGLEDEALKEATSKPDSLIVGHDLKSFYKKAIKEGRYMDRPAFDTKIAAYLLNPEMRDYEFEKIYYAQLNEMPGPDYRANLWRLKEIFEAKLQSSDLVRVFNDIEMPLIPVLAGMELNGIKVNIGVLSGLLKSVSIGLAKLEKEIYKAVGSEFNISSPRQLEEILFDKLGLKGKVRKTMGGARSTAAPELEKLRGEHPIIDSILQYRELQKLKTTYIEPFPGLIDPQDKRLHTTYNQTGAVTGRLSSQDPNLQNIPVRTELGQEFRKAFIADDGWELIAFDYSQIELRVAAHLASDVKMIKAFKDGEDIHTATAAEFFEVEPEKVTKEMRRQAKALNFGILFGMGSLGFARSAGVDRQRARDFIDKYFNKFSGIAKYLEETKQKARRDGYIATLFGRRRLMQDIYSTMPQVRAYAERMAVNMPIQGTEADIMKLAMVKVNEYLNKNDTKKETKILLQVHDELVLEIKKGTAGKIARQIKGIMESVCELDAPLVVDVKLGQNWQEMSPLSS